ncbi:hypothetical protein OC834_004867 [Tilletia horrida]|uniref:Cytochrome c oxidase assembly protein COX20, mitochondrial n=1 Tax=Tilletia horrida TaxID=155126 RepID=A0AAN6JS95_9BASI|nr:hypothetical protein OC835_007120 [Tilletia horrida]KAK0526266.1 hypothetical protein OC834_004867 [Tilletia horrida]KAK0535314.1 hypothetical protein OC842_002356 [Tilletia horrida]KAK0559284.1 hypothetical protein OC844_004516 [Tilletia horrida]
MSDKERTQPKTVDGGEALKVAVSKLSLDDFSNIGKIPCARGSLLNGIATAVGVFGVSAIAGRGIRRSANWSAGSFAFVAIASWEICRRQRRAEQARMKMIIETFPNRAAAAEADKKRAEREQPPVSRIAPSITS